MRVAIKHRICFEEGSTPDSFALVDWPKLQPYWERDIPRPPDPLTQIPKYNCQWFSQSSDGQTAFYVPEIYWDANRASVAFYNGRNRTCVICMHQPYVPVAFKSYSLDYSEFSSAIIKILKEGDIVELPNLPIVNRDELC